MTKYEEVKQMSIEEMANFINALVWNSDPMRYFDVLEFLKIEDRKEKKS